MNAGHPHRDAALALENEGQLEHALEAFLRAKLMPDAARVARKLGRHAEAGKLYAAASLHYEAAVCYSDAGDKRQCLAHLVCVPRAHKAYRQCCVKAIALAAASHTVNDELLTFLGPFTQSPPQNDGEKEALARFAALRNQGQTRRMVLDKNLQNLDAYQGQAPAARAAPRKAGPSLASLPGGPGLPSLPPPPNLVPPPQAPPQAPPPLAAASMATRALSAEHTPRAAPVVAPSAPSVSASSASREAPLTAGDLQAGSMIAGRYCIEKRIGEGGMATVFRARDTELDEDVAIKVFNMEGDDAEMISRFKQELALARKLAHPNILRMYDLGLDRGCRFITMELLHGRNLREVFQAARPTLRASLALLSQACAGLQAAHDNGVVHRDIKPENFFLTDEGVLKVMDFGIAKNTAASTKTRTGVIAGTAAYMSPEQIEGFSHVTHLSDLYALGICAYELCTGSVPFMHAEMVPLLMMHVKQAPRPPIELNPNIPSALNDLVLQLLAKDPSKRPQSARALAASFDRIRGAS